MARRPVFIAYQSHTSLKRDLPSHGWGAPHRQSSLSLASKAVVYRLWVRLIRVNIPGSVWMGHPSSPCGLCLSAKKVPGGHETPSGSWVKPSSRNPVRYGLGNNFVIELPFPGQALPPESAALAREVKTSRRRSYLSRCTNVSMPAGSGTYLSEILPMITYHRKTRHLFCH